ncbi:sensor domain-containing diguanylate cyclase [Metaplanococcus flavidus]|uniref:Diguanylate cyclase n=1 Tax=Metaplanococcus flavidus TaxID=569883 RepID=A0ABW3LBF7_9BACL
MEEQLDVAPVGYLVMDHGLRIVQINKTMLEMTGLETAPSHMHDLLTIASRVYFQTYFIPSIMAHGAVSEMYLSMKSSKGPIPVLMNTRKRNGLFECALMHVPVRNEYETEMLNAKRNAEQVSRATAEANRKLTTLLDEVEYRKSELNVLNNRLKELTVTDVLTGLKNRRYLEEFLPELIEDGGTALLMIDIDFFKKVNDSYGHHAGDIVLKNLAEVLEAAIGKAGFATRVGGEEFVVVLPAINLERAEDLAEHIRERVELHDWPYQPITVSIGVAQGLKGHSISEMLQHADAALYESKNAGRNKVTVAS